MKTFVIQWPLALWLLLALLPLGLLMLRAHRRRRELSQRLSGETVVRAPGRDGFYLAAMGLLILALARPGYAPERRAISQSGRDVVFALDVSRSMLAEDAHPSRLEAARQGVRDAIARFGSERAGLLIYAGSANILCPLTYDYAFVRYMLEQATPRAVDFGGTTLLAAVEKSVDNLFTDERAGMQDLVVLTDGEDHGPDLAKVSALLKEHGVDLLIVGLGDATIGSRIPLQNAAGETEYLKFEGDFVTTRLEESALQRLAAMHPGASYAGPGTGAFDLGEIYLQYAANKPTAGAIGSETFVVYREGGLPLVAIALLLLLFSSRGTVGLRRLLALLALGSSTASGAAPFVEATFARGLALQQASQAEEALATYAELETAGGLSGRVPTQLAALRFNQALCHLALARDSVTEAPDQALALAVRAQQLFLQAKRMDPTLLRAGQRLDTTAVLVSQYTAAVEAREAQAQAMQERMEALIERLEKWKDDQAALAKMVGDKEPQWIPPNPKKNAPPPPAPRTPSSSTEIGNMVGEQGLLRVRGRSIRAEMEAIDQILHAPTAEGLPPIESLLQEPLRLIDEALEAQAEAAAKLAEWTTWRLARTRQEIAVQRIEEIIDFLRGGQTSDSDESEGNEDDGDWDMEDYDEMGEGTPSSMPMRGDFAAGSEMQPLPIPNYSAEDLLLEEQGNLQFRQQQRSAAQAGKVEKDW